MACPPDKEPLGYSAEGHAMPLIVAPSVLERTRQMFPRLWVEPNQEIPE